jgi:hypothetical protein
MGVFRKAEILDRLFHSGLWILCADTPDNVRAERSGGGTSTDVEDSGMLVECVAGGFGLDHACLLKCTDGIRSLR